MQKWQYNFKIFLREIVCHGIDWFQLAQVSVFCQVFVNMNFYVP